MASEVPQRIRDLLAGIERRKAKTKFCKQHGMRGDTFARAVHLGVVRDDVAERLLKIFPVDPEEVLTIVAAHYGFMRHLLRSPSRKTVIEEARLILALMLDEAGMSRHDISRFMGYQSLSGSSKAIQSIHYAADPTTLDAIAAVRAKIAAAK